MSKRKDIKPLKMFTFSLPDDVADELDKLDKGTKSETVAKALREYFRKEAPQPSRYIAGGLTEEEILEEIEFYLTMQVKMKFGEIERKIDEAKEKGDFQTEEKLRRALVRLHNFVEDTKNEITMREVQKVLGLPYMMTYNKILPFLRHKGYKIVKQKKDFVI